MINKVIVSTDCVCDLPDKLVKKYDIPMMYYYMQVGEARFQDINEINSDNVLDYIVQEKEQIRTMCASMEEYSEFFQRVSDDGKKTVIHISLAKYASEGYWNAHEASKSFAEVYVIDSGKVSGAMGALVLAAADLAQKGATKDIILRKLAYLRDKVNCSFVMRSAQCLEPRKGPDKFMVMLCSTFSLHPFISLKNSDFSMMGFCVGNFEQSVVHYMNKCLKHKDKISDELLLVVTAGCDYTMQKYIIDEAQKHIEWKHVYAVKASATISCNSGSGTFGLAFFYK